MSTNPWDSLLSKSWVIWQRATSTPGEKSMWLTAMLAGILRTGLESELCALVPIMLFSWQTCLLDLLLNNFKETSLMVLITISSTLENSEPINSFLMLLMMQQSAWTLTKVKWLFWELNTPGRWRREFSPLWTTSCLRKDIYLFTPVAMSVQMVTTFVSSLDSQELVKLLSQLLETVGWLETTNMFGLIKEFSILKEDAMLNVLDLPDRKNQKSTMPSDSELSLRM